MNVLVIGAGVAGSVVGDLLRAAGHDVTILEKTRRPGGMCKSYYKDGFTYEYGPHILAMHHCSPEAVAYIKSHIDADQTELTSASCVGGTMTYYPPSVHSADRLGVGDQVRQEIARLPPTADETNFETYITSKAGPTIYRLFFESFTRKFWGIDPARLSAEWAKTRRLAENLDAKRMFFNDRWCAYPKKDWNQLFANVLRDVRVLYDVDVTRVDLQAKTVVTATGERLSYDFLVSTMHIDDLFESRLGRLKYAGYRIEPVILDRKSYAMLDDRPVSMTYYPDADVPYCRVTDYGSFQRKSHPPYDRRTIVTYEYPDHSQRLYPFTDSDNLTLFDQYLREAATRPDVLTFGRMGLYKYLTTDTTVDMALRALPLIGQWQHADDEWRYNAYKNIRGGWSN